MSELDDAVLFVCGGGANHIISDTHVDGIPVAVVNPNAAAPDDPMAMGDPDAISERLDGVRVAFVFAMLGGRSGTDMLTRVSGIARSRGCRVVAIAGLPMAFERDRRERAMDALHGIRGTVDRMLLMDVDTVLSMRMDANSETKFHAFFRASAAAFGFALRNLAHMVDGPFFSTFPEDAYTFAYVNDDDPARAVERALGATVFPTDPAYGKAIVTVSAGFGTAQLEQAFHSVVSNTGISPDIVKRDDMEDTKVLVFLPVRLGPAPRASRA